MELLKQLKDESQKTAEEVKKWATMSGAELEATFEKLKKSGKNNVENIVQWMKDVKLISSKESEDKARKELAGAADKQNIGLQDFTQAVTKMAADQTKTIEEFAAGVKNRAMKIAGAVQAGASAVQGALANTSNGSGTAKK